MDTQLDEVIPPQWDFASAFKGGFALVGVGGAVHYRGWRDEHGRIVGSRWGVIDRTGRLVVPVQDTPGEVPAPPSAGAMDEGR